MATPSSVRSSSWLLSLPPSTLPSSSLGKTRPSWPPLQQHSLQQQPFEQQPLQQHLLQQLLLQKQPLQQQPLQQQPLHQQPLQQQPLEQQPLQQQPLEQQPLEQQPLQQQPLQQQPLQQQPLQQQPLQQQPLQQQPLQLQPLPVQPQLQSQLPRHHGGSGVRAAEAITDAPCAAAGEGGEDEEGEGDSNSSESESGEEGDQRHAQSGSGTDTSSSDSSSDSESADEASSEGEAEQSACMGQAAVAETAAGKNDVTFDKLFASPAEAAVAAVGQSDGPPPVWPRSPVVQQFQLGTRRMAPTGGATLTSTLRYNDAAPNTAAVVLPSSSAGPRALRAVHEKASKKKYVSRAELDRMKTALLATVTAFIDGQRAMYAAGRVANGNGPASTGQGSQEEPSPATLARREVLLAAEDFKVSRIWAGRCVAWVGARVGPGPGTVLSEADRVGGTLHNYKTAEGKLSQDSEDNRRGYEAMVLHCRRWVEHAVDNLGVPYDDEAEVFEFGNGVRIDARIDLGSRSGGGQGSSGGKGQGSSSGRGMGSSGGKGQGSSGGRGMGSSGGRGQGSSGGRGMGSNGGRGMGSNGGRGMGSSGGRGMAAAAAGAWAAAAAEAWAAARQRHGQQRRQRHGQRRRQRHGQQRRQRHGQQRRQRHGQQLRGMGSSSGRGMGSSNDRHGQQQQQRHVQQQHESHGQQQHESHGQQQHESHGQQQHESHGQQQHESHGQQQHETVAWGAEGAMARDKGRMNGGTEWPRDGSTCMRIGQVLE
ncbi:hypothetical protein CLOP_g8002 [Closterium sp. NIES-67]|nr:hypothetical protein CLOP_g8002 [Closterium sp. NIES-67]